jgi:hypothetical protein
LRATSAALIVNEDFNYQNKYLQLKFADKFILNGKAIHDIMSMSKPVMSKPSVTTRSMASNEEVHQESIKTNMKQSIKNHHSNHQQSDIAEMVIAMNRKYCYDQNAKETLDAFVSSSSSSSISPQQYSSHQDSRESSLYTRLLILDQYQRMLKNEHTHHGQQANTNTNTEQVEMIVREFLSSWCWLLPLELTYVTFQHENTVKEVSMSYK